MKTNNGIYISIMCKNANFIGRKFMNNMNKVKNFYYNNYFILLYNIYNE